MKCSSRILGKDEWILNRSIHTQVADEQVLANILFAVWNDVNRDFYLMFVVAV